MTHWQPTQAVSIDHLEVDPYPAVKSRFFCIQNWDSDRKAAFLREDAINRESSDAELLKIQRIMKYKNHELKLKKAGKLSAAGQPQRAGTNSLVSTRKSPTASKTVNKRAPVARIYERAWSGEFRVSIESFTKQGDAPAPQAGARYTEKLSARAARSIIDSGAYMAACKGGYSTFLTLTFTPEQRQQLETIIWHKVGNGEAGEMVGAYDREHMAAGKFTRIEQKPATTMGREVSRFFDAMQKKHQRGWTWKPTEEEQADMLEIWQPERFAGQDEKINYCWVAENPDSYVTKENGVGELVRIKQGTNPHIHVLMDWSVEKLYFRGWAEQIETLWGKGFAKLEKIRDTRAASTYLMKALGYLTKGANTVDTQTGELINSQGVIQGNRYGISSAARAPKWECIAEYYAEQMSRFVADVGQQIAAKHERMKDAIKQAESQKKDAVNKLAALRNVKTMPADAKAQKLKDLERKIEKMQAAAKGIREKRYTNAYANKYKVTFKSKDQINAFFKQMIGQVGWIPKIARHALAYADDKAKGLRRYFLKTQTNKADLSSPFNRSLTNAAKNLAVNAGRFLSAGINAPVTVAGEIAQMITREQQNQECYWQAVLNDALPPEPDNYILLM